MCLLSPSSGRLIALMMEEVSISETSVNNQSTQHNIPEDSHVHTRRRENLKFHHFLMFLLKMPHF
jgi:hypothetical protein